MNSTVTHISEADYAELVALLDKRRRLERSQKLARSRSSRQRLTLAQKLEADAPFKAKLAEVNEQIDELMKPIGGAL